MLSPVLLPQGANAKPSTGGTQLWVDRFNRSASSDDYAYALGVSPDGPMAYVTGTSTGGTGYDYATLAYATATGQRLWTSYYDGPANQEDIAFALEVSPEGSNVFVTGESVGSDNVDYATVAYDAATGTQLWVARYNGPGNAGDEAFSVAVSPGGGVVVVTGLSYASQFKVGYATAAYDSATGKQLWLRRYDGPAGGNQALAVAVSPGGGMAFVTGESYVAAKDAYDYATVAYDTFTGRQLWVARYKGPVGSDNVARALDVSPDGATLYVTGESIGADGDWDYATVAYDPATGQQLWVTRYAGPPGGDDYPSSLKVSPGGSRVFVTGYSTSSNGAFDYATLAYDAATGRQLWVSRYNGSGDGYDYAYGLGVSPGGSKVFVTGYSLGSTTGIDYATVAYAAGTGSELWVQRYNGPANADDSAFGLGVSPGGKKVFVTGGSDGFTSASDIVTIAYHA